MQSIIRVIKTLRNHWKKSVFATVVCTYGGVYAKNKYKVSQLMRAYCEEAKKYGEEPLPSNSKAYHVTVILNPAAQDGKGKILYEKYAAPLLNLSGLKISIIQTEKEGQARDIMEIMDNTDSVVIAGGDGTLHEAVTGLLRRPDQERACKHFSLGIIPIGKTNTVAKALFWEPTSCEAQWLAEATMAVIKQVRKPLDVIKVEGEKGRPVFALSSVQMGIFRDTAVTHSKYWYFGPLKNKVAYIFRALKEWPPNKETELSYVLPCGGCSSCYKPPTVQPVSSSRRWWEAFLPRKPIESHVLAKDYSNLINEECGIWHSQSVPFTNLVVCTNKTAPAEKDDTYSSLNVNIHPMDLSRKAFIKEGWSLSRTDFEKFHYSSSELQAREIKLIPKVNEDKEEWYSIDNENYEMQPVHILLIPKKVHLYCKETL